MNEAIITRVLEMEARLNNLLTWLSSDLSPTESIKEDARILDDYYSGGQWLSDFEADEAGELPADLPRGVLSEDALYNALMEYEERIGNAES